MRYETHEGGTTPVGASDLTDKAPAITFESLTFSDGTTIALDPTDIVVFVGPNNAGKSVALRELNEHLDKTQDFTVVKSAERRTTGSPEDFGTFINKHLQITNRGSSRHYSGHGVSFSMGGGTAEQMWPNGIGVFKPLFCMQIPTKTRITDSDPVNAIDVLNETASHPIQMLYSDDQLECRISGYFRQAFGEDLVVFHAGGRTIPLLVGKRPLPVQGEQFTSRAYSERLRSSTVPLEEQGDGMRSFASAILHLLSPITPSILLLDEPEAFLHPPQARLLGEVIAVEKSSHAQLFVATHSTDVLHGLINVASNNLQVLRMQRDGNVNRIKKLDKRLVKKISTDPLMKYSSVMSGVFHERVIICEADADCLFYGSLLDLPQVHGDRQPDVLFVHANGKSRMATLAEALVALDVPVDIVADIDVLNDLNVLKGIVNALYGDWTAMKPIATAVKKAIEEHKPSLSLGEIKKAIADLVNEPSSEDDSQKKLQSKISEIFGKASPWDAVKVAGEAALPPDQPTQQFQKLQRLCKEIGLWIVPVGEMEGFCKSVGGHGPNWVRQVIEQRELAIDPELERARNFVREVWESRRRNGS